MGLSLRNIGRKITDIASRGYDQANVFDNGLSATTRQINPAIKPQSVLGQVTHNAITDTFGGAVKGTAQAGYGLYKGNPFSVPNVISSLKGAGDLLTGDIAGSERNARAIVDNIHGGVSNARSLGQGTAAQAYQLGESINPTGGDVYNRTHIPTGGLQKIVLGSDPIPSMQTQFKTTAKEQGRGHASAEALLTSLMDASALKQGAGDAIDIAKEAPKLQVKLNEKLVELPEQRVNLKDQATLRDFSDKMVGANKASGTELNKLLSDAREVGKKHSVDLVNGTRTERLERANFILDQIGVKNKNEIGAVGRNVIEKPKVVLKKPSELQVTTQMHDILNGGGTVDEALNHHMQVTGGTKGAAELALQKVLKVSSLDKSQINAKLNPEHGNVTLGAVTLGDHTQPILNSHAVATNAVERGNTALEAIKKLSSTDHALLDDLRTTSIDKLAKRAESPAAFREAANATKAYNDFTQAAGAHLGQDVPYRQNYGAPLLFEQAPEEIAAARKAMLKEHPGYGKSRTFRNYDEAAQYGLTRQNPNFASDILTDVQRRSADLKGLALKQGLEQAYPGLVKEGEIGVNQGGVFTQLQIGGGNRISLPAELADEINRRASGTQPTGALKAYDQLNANLKYYKLGGGTFHGVTEAGNIAGQQLLSGNLLKHPIDNLKIINGTFSDKAHQAHMAGFAERGVVENARLAGVTLGENQILGDIKPANGLKKVPVIHQIHEAIFKRQIPEAKLTIFEQQTKGLDPTIPADLAKMRSVARAVNNMGGINRAVDGLTPQTARKLSRAVLATDFTEGRWRTIDAAIRKGGPEGKIARQMVVGKTVVFLLPTLAAATAAGKIDWNDPEDVAKNIGDQILDPHFPTPFKGKTGIERIAKTPETFISEVGRMLKPVFDGEGDRLSGVKHYVTARSSAALSLANQVKTNQDYFGNPIIAHDENGKVNLGKSVTNVAINSAPIPVVQGIKTAQGKQGVGEAAINTLGARVVSNPNDPQMKAFNFQDKAVAKLNDNEKKLWESVYGSNKDKYGNPITVTPTLDSQNNAYTLLTNPKLLDVGRQINDFKKTQGLSSDPFFELPRDKQTVVLNSAIDKFRNPAEKKVLRTQNPWLDQYNKDRSAYFDSLPKNPDAIAKTKELPEPLAPTSASQYFTLQDPAQKSSYLADHPEITDYFDAHDKFIREGRAKQNLPQYDKYPTPDAGTQKLLDTYNALPKANGPAKKDGTPSSPARSAWIKTHPNEWNQITAQYSKAAQYNLEQGSQEAAYQGQDYNASDLKDIVSLAKSLGVDTGSSSYGSGGSSDPTSNAYKYAVSRSAGGTVARPKISFRAPTIAKGKVKSKGKSRIATKITRSKV